MSSRCRILVWAFDCWYLSVIVRVFGCMSNCRHLLVVIWVVLGLLVFFRVGVVRFLFPGVGHASDVVRGGISVCCWQCGFPQNACRAVCRCLCSPQVSRCVAEPFEWDSHESVFFVITSAQELFRPEVLESEFGGCSRVLSEIRPQS